MVYIIDKTNKSRDGRGYDLEELRKSSNSSDPLIRKNAYESAIKIGKESGLVRSMRERLIKEHRKGNTDNIKDIHEYIQNKERFQNR